MELSGVVLFAYYILIGTGHVLLSQESQRQGLRYSPMVAVFLAEFFKCVIASTIHFGTSAGKNKKTSAAHKVKCAIPGALYAVQNILNIVAVGLLQPHVFALFNNLKTMTAAIFSGLILGRSYSFRQWTGMLVLLLSCSCSKWEDVQRLAQDLTGAATGDQGSFAANPPLQVRKCGRRVLPTSCSQLAGA